MAGFGSRFKDFLDPKPFIEIQGKRMIERVIDNLNPINSDIEKRFILVCRREHYIKYKDIIDNLKATKIEILLVDFVPSGTLCSVINAIDLINTNEEIVIANSDQIIDDSIDDFIKFSRKYDGCLMTFSDNDPKWSYVSIDENNMVNSVVEKKVVSNFANVGIFYFKRGDSFCDSAIDMIKANETLNNEFYVAPVYNYLIKKGNQISYYNIEKDKMHGLGIPEDLDKYICRLTIQK